jgi:MerR family transcriptional regulator, repressor of the yfmOP operon
MTDERLRIGKVAELTGTTPRTIRYYEEVGLLTASKREPGSHRLYEAADVERLTEVLRLKDLLGISLDEVKQLAAAEQARALRRQEWRSGVEDPVRRREILEQGLSYVDRQLELVRSRRDEIAELEAELNARRRRLTRYLREQVPEPAA